MMSSSTFEYSKRVVNFLLNIYSIFHFLSQRIPPTKADQQIPNINLEFALPSKTNLAAICKIERYQFYLQFQTLIVNRKQKSRKSLRVNQRTSASSKVRKRMNAFGEGGRKFIVQDNYIKQSTRGMSVASKYEGIVITSKEEYSCLQKCFCCRCCPCLQEEIVMTSDIRKETIRRMIEDYIVDDTDELLMDPVKLMILIYVCNDDSVPSRHIERFKINPSTGVINYRTDLEFYIPQLCNFIVFYRSLQNNYLKDAVERMCRLNFYFAHLYYFYMKSLERYITKTEVQVIKPVVTYNERFLKELSQDYREVKLTCLDLYINEHQEKVHESDTHTRNAIFEYETKKMEFDMLSKVKGKDILLSKYSSIFGDKQTKGTSFESTIIFFDDLFFICDELKKHEDKKEKMIEYAKIINEGLPSTAYIPFSKNAYRLCNILKIVTSEVKVFSTKERAPVCLCIETFCPAEGLSPEQMPKFWVNVETPITLKMLTFSNRSQYFARNFQKTAEFKRHRQTTKKIKVLGHATNIMEEQRLANQAHNSFHLKPDERLLQTKTKSQKHVHRQLSEIPPGPYRYSASLGSNRVSTINKSVARMDYADVQLQLQKIPQIQEEGRSKSAKLIPRLKENVKAEIQQALQNMFGQPLLRTKDRICRKSIFGNLPSWDILYIIIKTHDDLKQEQFAMQLIHQFDYIFKLQHLPLLLTTYEVLSMGADRGIIEMVKDSVTFDRLQKTLQTGLPLKLSLKQFFEVYYSDDLINAKQNFTKSLAAYSLVMYIIQVKDRHNGNIMLHRNGKMFHIDFGFFLSNMPGKGIELERNCPFKLLTSHVEVLDGIDSYYFKKFREYFYLGFKAIRKHQNKVLMLVKLMYSTSGMSMPCFAKGEETITAMERRINPPQVTNDLLLNQHCQMLINYSLDNWASKWYDRFQYWAQGIFY